jgi:hypothetical protein
MFVSETQCIAIEVVLDDVVDITQSRAEWALEIDEL